MVRLEQAAAIWRPDRRDHAGQARRDIHATKIIARLVAAIARTPGSGVPNDIKSAHLAGLLRSAREAALRIASFVAPADAHRNWVRAMTTEAAVTVVAAQWEPALARALAVDPTFIGAIFSAPMYADGRAVLVPDPEVAVVYTGDDSRLATLEDPPSVPYSGSDGRLVLFHEED